ncbi:DUF1929 domain-containing protein [Myxococcota bacterium]|nr:DUF1929 domain-containing protein [Myxococcota bacterium]
MPIQPSRPWSPGRAFALSALVAVACDDTPAPVSGGHSGADAGSPGNDGAVAAPDAAGRPSRPDVGHAQDEVPRTFIEGDPPAHTNQRRHALALTASVAFSHFDCALDDAPLAPCPPRPVLSDLAEGPHTFRAVAITPYGVRDPVGDSLTFTVDVTAPDVRLIEPVPARLDAARVAVVFEIDEPGSMFCTRDGGGRRPCTSPVLVDDLPEGFTGLVITGVDRAANADPTPLEVRFEIDRTAPETSITAAPPALHRSTEAEIGFTSPNADAIGFRCALDGAEPAPCTSPVGLAGLSEGLHAFSVAAVDALGHVDETPATTAFEVRVTPPDGEIRTGPPARTTETSARFTFGPDDARFRCALDAPDEEAMACASPFDVEDLAEGRHVFSLIAHDGAGHADPTPATLAWLVDRTPPTLTIVSGPPALSSAPAVEVRFEAEDAPEAAPVEVLCALDDAPPAPCASPFVVEVPGEGAHVVELTARDDLGNTTPQPARLDFAIDRTPPLTLFWETPPPETRETAARFDFETEAGAALECSLDEAPFAPCRPPVALRGLDDGLHRFHVRARDAAGNTEDPPRSVEWRVDTTAPRLRFTQTPPAVSLEADVLFDFTTAAPEPSAFYECRLDDGPFAPCEPPVRLVGLSEGEHAFEVVVSDALGNAEPDPAPVAFTVDALAPTPAVAPEVFAGDGRVYVRWPAWQAEVRAWHLVRRAEGDPEQSTLAVRPAGAPEAEDADAIIGLVDEGRADGVTLEYALRAEDAHGRVGAPGPAVRARPTGQGRSVALPALPPGLGTAALTGDGRVVLGLDVPDAVAPWAFTLRPESGELAPAPAVAPLAGAALAQLPDGRLFAVGGLGPLFVPPEGPAVRGGSEAAQIWQADAGAFVAAPPLPGGPRAHALALVVPGGYVAVAGGLSVLPDDAPAWRVDLFDPTFDAWAAPFPAPRETLVPGLWGVVGPDGALLMFGPEGAGLRADPVRLDYTFIDPPAGPSPGVTFVSGPGPSAPVWALGGGGPPTGATWRFDPSLAAWAPGPVLNTARRGAAAVVLPTREVLILGGSDGPAEAERLAPDGSLRGGGPLNHGHETAAWALLLASGEVLVGSAEGGLERYQPWYLDASVGPRALVTEAPAVIEPGAPFDVVVSAPLPVERVVVARRGAVTGGRDTDARVVELQVTPLGADRVRLLPPEDVAALPPGPYVMFAVDVRGAPGPGRPITVD